jgi:hypothetical protein
MRFKGRWAASKRFGHDGYRSYLRQFVEDAQAGFKRCENGP